ILEKCDTALHRPVKMVWKPGQSGNANGRPRKFDGDPDRRVGFYTRSRDLLREELKYSAKELGLEDPILFQHKRMMDESLPVGLRCATKGDAFRSTAPLPHQTSFAGPAPPAQGVFPVRGTPHRQPASAVHRPWLWHLPAAHPPPCRTPFRSACLLRAM